MKFFDPKKRFQRDLLQVELAAFKARCEASDMMVEAERMREDMERRADRKLEDSARWADYERQRLALIEKHRQIADGTYAEPEKIKSSDFAEMMAPVMGKAFAGSLANNEAHQEMVAKFQNKTYETKGFN